MPTLHFWDKAPDGQWPVAKLVQEFYKEIYPAHPDGVMAGDLSYHRLWRLATLSSTAIPPNSFMALLLQHFILARHMCPAAVFFLSQSNPAQAFLYQPTALSEESHNELTKITPLVEKYAHSIIQEDPFLCNTAMRLDPLKDFLYLAPQSDESTFRNILNAQIGPYAQAIAEIGDLSVSTALIPGAPRAWVDAVFNTIPVLTPHEAVPVRMFFFNPADTIEGMTRPYTSPPSETTSSPNLSRLELSPYDSSINFSNEFF
ncbi:hypothetical protein PQX77_015166 [Marasmius sp. AFHP31]|nr:hypothetical protein PQX77_015166 [Marasmius sp. AFHP31]